MTTMIWMQEISKIYRMGEFNVPVLKQINLSIAQGELVAIMGASGSGKSTLMNLIGCLDRPTSGHYILAGKNLTTLNADELSYIRNQRIGFVFQQFNLLSRSTALENVMLPLIYANVPRQKRRQLAIQALTQVGLADRLHNRPSQLSGGQQQRVAIARALVNRPALVLADEPTGALDSETSQEVMHLLKQLNQQGMTIVIVTHNPQVAAQTKRVIQIQDGAIVHSEKRSVNYSVSF